MGATNLRLVVENLGPIEHADVELKPLTVLIGKNNTGKTYLAQALYATHKSVKPFGLQDALDDDEIDILLRASQTSSKDPLELPPELEVKANNWINSALTYSGSELQNNLRGYFGVPDLENITRWDQRAKVIVELHKNRIDQGRTCLFRNTKNESLSLLTVPKDVLKFDKHTIPYKSIFWHIINENEEDKRIRNSEASFFITRAVWDEFLRYIGLDGKAHYLPAGRSGLLNAWTDVVKLRFELERERFGLSRVPDSSLGGVTFDFISSLANIIGPRRPYHYPIFRRENPFDNGPQALLEALMGGKIRAGSAEEMVPILEYQQDGHKIAVHRASSMVADLAPLAMWLEHLVSTNDLLIIDEPESHLHPEAIRLVARVLVGLVNQGVKVVCATHSSVLLHELSNCILRGQLKDKYNEPEKYPDTEYIALEDIAVYRFQHPQPAGPVQVSQVEIEHDWGIPEDEYVKVASELSDDTADLIDQLTC